MPPRARKREGGAAASIASKPKRVKAEVVPPAPLDRAKRFPPTILFEDPFENGVGVYTRPPRDWNDSADRAAARVSREVRLLGTAELTVVLGEGEGDGNGDDTADGENAKTKRGQKKQKKTSIVNLLQSLAAPIQKTHKNVTLDHRHTDGCETWNSFGEPGHGGGLLPIGQLYEALDTGAVTIAEPHGPSLVAALAAATLPFTSPWKVPLIRCVCVVGFGSLSESVDSSGTSTSTQASSTTLTFAVYCSRLIFELIADDNVNFIVKHLTPVAPPTHPVSPATHYDPAFKVDQAEFGEVDQFTLPGLLAAAVTEGGPSAQQPAGLKVEMLDFQKQTLFWMRDKETSVRGLNGQFWEERRWGDDYDVEETEGGLGGDENAEAMDEDETELLTSKSSGKKTASQTKKAKPSTTSEGKFWYFPLAGELRLEEPPVCRGGMLCEEMGLGKTVEVLGLVCADMEEARRSAKESSHAKEKEESAESDENAAAEKIPSRATLVVVPPPLLRQWEAECGKCVAHGFLSVKVYQGNRGGSKTPTHERARALADADVVLCTYPQLQREATSGKSKTSPENKSDSKILTKIKWRRVVLDECQMVRSSTTQLAVACADLHSDFRWMVSGTPLHGSVDDLNGELHFLGVWPFCLSDRVDGFWAHRIGSPFVNKDPECLRLVHALLRGVCVRHTKAQRRVADGTPLLTLPSARTELRVVTHGSAPHEAPSERFVCNFLEHHASVAARGVLQTLFVDGASGTQNNGNGGTAHHVRTARALAQKLLRLVRGATTSATTVRSRLREVEEAMRAASARGAGGRDAAGGRGLHGGFRDAHGQLNASAVEAAAAADVDRVRALPAGLALLELMAPREANNSGPAAAAARVHRGSPADTGRVASAFALRNANMLSFEADRQAWRGTSRTYADAGGADLAHKLAVVADGVFKLLRAAWDRDHREDTTSQIKLHALCGSSARNSASARREAGRAKLHRLQHAFPGSLVNLCACPGWSCGCRAGGADDDTHETCCEGAKTFRDLSLLENKAGRTKEATAVASAADAAALDAVAATRAPLPKLRWLLAVELITSGAAFDLFGDAAAAPGTYFETETETERRRVDSIFLRKRLGFRFLRRAFLAKRLECLVTAADLNVDRARAAAQARDVTNPDSKPKRAMHKAPELLQHAYRAATGDAKQARATRRDETPSGVRVLGSGGSLLSNVLPKLHSKTNGPLAAHAVRDLLRDAVANTQHRACRLVEEIGTLAPYMRALAAAGVNGVDQTSLDHASVKQSGFGLVDDIATGKTPQCCICCAPATQPTIARCMHLACARCMVTWFHAAPMHGAAASSGGAPCPLCRKPFFIEELIRLLPNEVEVDDDGDGDDDVSRGKGEGTERGSGSTGRGEGEGTVKTKTITGNTSKGKGKALAAPSAGTDNATDDAVGSSRVPKPKFSFAATPADFARLPLPSHENPTDHRDGRYPALSMDGGRFLAHVHRACARQSPKISAVVSDLREAIAVPNGSGKAVVFSQLRDALAHCADALTWEGIGNVLVDGGVGRGGSSRNTGPGGTATATDTDTNGNETTRTVVRPEDDAARAVQRFRDDEDCHVLLLHAGSASAGLTLTHADLVILLEPFLSPGDEAQAANRVHRIGQKRPVRCVTYFVCGSVEERLLAFRERQAEFGGGEGDGAGGSGIASATTTPNAAASASALGVAPENETDAFSTHMSRAQFHRMRFVFGLASGENGENGRGRAE